MGNVHKFPIQVINYDKRIAHIAGINTALLYAELMAEYETKQYQGQIDELGGFETSTEYIQSQIGLSYYQQKKAFDKLRDLRLISVEICGLPPRKNIQFINSEGNI